MYNLFYVYDICTLRTKPKFVAFVAIVVAHWARHINVYDGAYTYLLACIGNQIKIKQLANSKSIFSLNRSERHGEDCSRFYNLQSDTLALAVWVRLLKFISILSSVCLFKYFLDDLPSNHIS